MDTYQTAPIGGASSVSTLFVNTATKKISTDDFNVIGILRVNILLECVYICIFSFNHEQKY